MKTWNDATTDQVWQTLDCIHDARGLYELDHFPADVRELVRRDYRRIFSGDSPKKTIFAHDGSTPEAMNAVCGLDLAQRISDELKLSPEYAHGWQSALRRIKGAFLHREYGYKLNSCGEAIDPPKGKL